MVGLGEFGGQCVAETLMPAITELEAAWRAARADASYWSEVDNLLANYVGRPSLLYHARRLSKDVGAAVYLKREDLNHTGAHKINNCIGQAVLARRMGKRRFNRRDRRGAARCRNGHRRGAVRRAVRDLHGHRRRRAPVAGTSSACASLRRRERGARTLKDAMNEALRDWVTNVGDTFYLIGSVAGPHPYPWMVRDLQSVIGREARAQIHAAAGRLPDALVACVGGGSNAAACSRRSSRTHRCASSVSKQRARASSPRGTRPRSAAVASACCTDPSRTCSRQPPTTHMGQIAHARSSARASIIPALAPSTPRGRRPRGVHGAHRRASARSTRTARTPENLCALETAHAIAALDEVASLVGKGGIIIVGLSGRGDKDMVTVAARRAEKTT